MSGAGHLPHSEEAHTERGVYFNRLTQYARDHNEDRVVQMQTEATLSALLL